VHSLSTCYGLLTELLLLNSVTKWCNSPRFSQKSCHVTCLWEWASEGIFPGGSTSGFFQKFLLREAKTPICLCVGHFRATPLKIWVISRVLTPFQIVKFYWILYAKWNIWQINFNCVFVFLLATLNSYILFLHWQHNCHPYGQLASCYASFVLSLHSGI